MRERLEGLHRRLCRHRAWRFGELLARGYLDHDVGKSAAALAYYLLFSFFPLLIFLSTLVGFLELPPLRLDTALQNLIPREVIELVNVYLQHVTELRSGNLLAMSLIITLWLPMRAVDSLMKAVNVSYGIKSPRPTLRHQLVVGLYTLFLMAVMMLTLVLMLAGRGFLTFLSRYLPVIQPFIGLWNALRFPIMGTAFFLALGVLYWVAPGITGPRRRVFPGAVAALCSWLVFLLSSYPLSMTKVAFPSREAPRSIAEKVTSLMEVKSFSFEEWIFEKRLTGWPLPVRAQASVT